MVAVAEAVDAMVVVEDKMVVTEAVAMAMVETKVAILKPL